MGWLPRLVTLPTHGHRRRRRLRHRLAVHPRSDAGELGRLAIGLVGVGRQLHVVERRREVHDAVGADGADSVGQQRLQHVQAVPPLALHYHNRLADGQTDEPAEVVLQPARANSEVKR